MRRTAQAYVDLFSSPSGRLVLLDLMRRGGILSTSMDKSAEMTAFNEGRRSMVLDILARSRVNMQDVLKYSMEVEEDG